jgi:hypothetical protein
MVILAGAGVYRGLSGRSFCRDRSRKSETVALFSISDPRTRQCRKRPPGRAWTESSENVSALVYLLHDVARRFTKVACKIAARTSRLLSKNKFAKKKKLPAG